MSPNSGTHFGDLFSVPFIVFLLDFDLILILTFTMYAWYSFEFVAHNITIFYAQPQSSVASHAVENNHHTGSTIRPVQHYLTEKVTHSGASCRMPRSCNTAEIINTAELSHLRQNHLNTTEHQCNIRSSHNTAQWSSCHT
jgi:hypothetical protein